MCIYIYRCTSWIFKSDAVGNSDRGSTPGNLETDEHLKLPRREALSHSFGEPYATLESLESRIVMFDRLRKTSGSWCTQMRGKYASGSWTWIFLASESPLVKNGFTMDLPSAFSKMMFNKGKICPSYSAYGLTYLHPISGEKIWKPIVDRQTHCCQKHSKTHIAIHTALSIPKEGLWGLSHSSHDSIWFRAAGHMRTQGLNLPHIFAAGPRIGHLSHVPNVLHPGSK